MNTYMSQAQTPIEKIAGFFGWGINGLRRITSEQIIDASLFAVLLYLIYRVSGAAYDLMKAMKFF